MKFRYPPFALRFQEIKFELFTVEQRPTAGIQHLTKVDRGSPSLGFSFGWQQFLDFIPLVITDFVSSHHIYMYPILSGQGLHK
ncbi:hypothetical protein B2K_19675 [Paenibacillus mucilaginosus K02]|uniref:Uncharacterized protein n=1 Tax=Paenibacillus mucilaginosus K02 TaxID=997761 RepID=I0BKK7_9BACL|nr:hypothetical protein B2K_19675 [Paenibacillus mucilaginosus K02]